MKMTLCRDPRSFKRFARIFADHEAAAGVRVDAREKAARLDLIMHEAILGDTHQN